MAEDTSNLKANFPNHIKSCFEQEQVKRLDLELSFKMSWDCPFLLWGDVIL